MSKYHVTIWDKGETLIAEQYAVEADNISVAVEKTIIGFYDENFDTEILPEGECLKICVEHAILPNKH